MRQLISTLLLSALLFSQENSVQQDTVSQAIDIESQPIDSLSQSPGQQDAEINTNDSAQPEPVNQILSSITSKPKICATPQFDFDLSSQSAQLGFLDGTMYSVSRSLSISKTAS